MKIQIFEQWHGGHYTNYIEALLPTLTKLADEVVVTITPNHLNSESFQQQLASYSELVRFDPCLPELKPNVTLKRSAEVAFNLVNSVRRIKPDYLISPSADVQSMFLAAKAFCGMQTLPRNVRALGVVHHGFGDAALKPVERMKESVYRFSLKHSPWNRLLIINPLVYEWISRQGGQLAERSAIIPDPIPSSTYFDKKTARNLLKIPTEGRYVGFIGMMDSRKAIPALVAAFRDATSARTDRLLLAGSILPEYKQLIESEFAELLELERVIILDRYLTADEMTVGFCALDIVSTVYERTACLSTNFLKAIAARRPVIADSFGYTGMIVKNFDVGWSCNVLDHEALVATLRRGLEESESYHVNERTERLIQFHHPENFIDIGLMDLRNMISPGCVTHSKTWEWVLGDMSTPANALSVR